VKKISIKLQSGSLGHTFMLFTDPETLYVWLKSSADHDGVPSTKIELRPGEFIEAEWRGCEYVYEGNGNVLKLNLIRLAKASPTQNASGMLANIAYGWVSDDVVPMGDYSDSEIIVHRMLLPAEARLDLPAMFKDDETEPESL
jgi:hypothetical protein